MTGRFVDVIKSDTLWVEFVDEHGPAAAAQELRQLIADLGQQEQRRVAGLAEAKRNPEIDRRLLTAMQRDLGHWRKSASRVRQGAMARLSSVRASAQAAVDAAQADRRSLVILAKRISLWEDGADDDGLDTALDDCTIANDPDGHTRVTLRELINQMRNEGQEITP